MTDLSNLLNTLIETSPLISEHIYGQRSALMNSQADALTMTDLVLESFDILLVQLEDQGITFHIDRESLFSDFYNAKYIIELYNSYIIDRLVERLENDQQLYMNIISDIDHISESELIVHIINAANITEPTEFTNGMMIFLHDKVMNTKNYYDAVKLKLNDAARGFELDKLSDVDADTMNFLTELVNERKHYYSIIGDLAKNPEVDVTFNIDISKILANNFRLEYSRADVMSVLAQYKSLHDLNKKIVDTMLKRIHINSVYYLEGKTDVKLTADSVVGIIVAKLSDERLFGITPDFTELMSVVDYSEQLIRIITKLYLSK